MPVDYQQIYRHIKEIGLGAGERRRTLEERRSRARALLSALADRLDVLRSKVDSARAVDRNIRCAVPLNEALTCSHPPPPEVRDATVIAADGSQVNPDRHASVQFGLVNVCAIVMKLNSGKAPEIHMESELLFDQDLLPGGIPMAEGMVALKRDLAERTALDGLSEGVQGGVVTLTDGPIELWGAKGEDSRSFDEFLRRYLGVLSRLQTRGVVTAGYVDKPSANLVVRLLEIASASPDELRELHTFRPLSGVSDRWLFGENEQPLLPPGCRSAVFGLQSGSESKYTGALSLHFFYLNVGGEGHPWPVRVEVPKWVAEDREKLDLLHGVLVGQCRLMGSRPYPYLLHRAHETASVGLEEKIQIEQLLTMEMLRNNEELDHCSYKQSAKNLDGRTHGWPNG
jgi:hypothetical protein